MVNNAAWARTSGSSPRDGSTRRPAGAGRLTKIRAAVVFDLRLDAREYAQHRSRQVPRAPAAAAGHEYRKSHQWFASFPIRLEEELRAPRAPCWGSPWQLARARISAGILPLPRPFTS